MSDVTFENAPIQKIIALFKQAGHPSLAITSEDLDAVFSKDFCMIAQGKSVCHFAGLLEHFEHIRSQIGKAQMRVHEFIFTPEKQVLRYDILTEKKGMARVLAIFKYRLGENLCYEMNEVFCLDSAIELDMSK